MIDKVCGIPITGIPLENAGLANLTVVRADGRREPLTGFAQYAGERLQDALNRTATEMNATIICEPAIHAPD